MEVDGWGTHLENVIPINDELIHDHRGKVSGGSVEATRNALLGTAADRLFNADRYQRSALWGLGLRTRTGVIASPGLRRPTMRKTTETTNYFIQLCGASGRGALLAENHHERNLEKRPMMRYCYCWE